MVLVLVDRLRKKRKFVVDRDELVCRVNYLFEVGNIGVNVLR